MAVDVDIIEEVSRVECLARKARSNLFFDQAGRESVDLLGTDVVIGWYGNSALEAAVHAIPTIAHLSGEVFEGARRRGMEVKDRCAIIHTPLRPDGIEQTLGWHFSLSRAGGTELSRRVREWVEEFHSQEAVARELQVVYEGLR